MQQLRLSANKGEKKVVKVKGVTIGGNEVILMGGPCAVESKDQVNTAAKQVSAAGAKVLRGGIFKPRSSPYSFQGLGLEGLDYLVDAAYGEGLLTVTEVIDAESLKAVAGRVDIIQIGARNMQNFSLLKLAGELKQPIILKRGLAATVEEWLLAAEYILAGGNPNVILCERGIRTFETSTRNTLDLSSVAVAKALSNLPVIVDPSHAAGRRELVSDLAKAAIAAGADGLLIEMHPEPKEALCDGAQSLYPEEFKQLARELAGVAHAVGRTFSLPEALSLDSLRTKIDSIDSRLVALLAERMEVVRKVAGQKSMERVRDVNREREIIQRLVSEAASQDCPPELIKEIYGLIFDYGVKCQIQKKLAREIDQSIG